MDVLVDSNVLLRIVESGSPQHAVAVAAVRRLEQHHRLVIVPQIVYEFWSVATRSSEANGLGRSVDETSRVLTEFSQQFPLLRDERSVFHHWWDLVRTYHVKGRRVHDTRIVAAMVKHGIHNLLTFNGKDFSGYREIDVLVPEVVIADSA